MNRFLDELQDDPLLINANEESESLIVMGVNDLSSDAPEKAYTRFDKALEKSHRSPAAWLGKAYAEVYATDELDEVLETLENNLLKAIEYADTERDFAEIIECCTQNPDQLSSVEESILRHYLALLTILIQRNTTLVREKIKKAVTAEAKAESAQKAANIGAFLAGAGIGVSATADTWKGKAAGAGGALLAGSASGELEVDAEELSVLQESAWGEAIAHCIGILPFDKSATGLKELILDPDDDAREEASRALTEWRTTVKVIFEKRLASLKEEVEDKRSAFRRDSKISTVLENGGLDGIDEFSDLNRKIKEVNTLLEPAAWSYYGGPERFKDLGLVEALSGLKNTLKSVRSEEVKENHTKTKWIKRAIYVSCSILLITFPDGGIFYIVVGISTYFLYTSYIQGELLGQTKVISNNANEFDFEVKNEVQKDLINRETTKATF